MIIYLYLNLDNADFILSEHSHLNPKLKESIKYFEQSKLNETKLALQSIENKINSDSVDYSIWASLYSNVLFNQGFYKNAIKVVSKAIKNFQNIYHEDVNNTFLLNLQLNHLTIKSNLTSNFDESRKEFLKFMAVVSTLNDKRLIAKVNSEYAAFLISAGQKRASLPYSKIAFQTQKEIIPFDYNLYASSSQTLISSYDSASSNNYFERKRVSSFYQSVLKTSLENNDNYSAGYIYINNAANMLNELKYNESLINIDKAIEILEKNGFEDKLLATAYLKKWHIQESIGRTITSKHYLSRAKDIMTTNYGNGSYDLSKFYQMIIMDLIFLNHIEEAKQYAVINNQVVTGLSTHSGAANSFTNDALLLALFKLIDSF